MEYCARIYEQYMNNKKGQQKVRSALLLSFSFQFSYDSDQALKSLLAPGIFLPHLGFHQFAGGVTHHLIKLDNPG